MHVIDTLLSACPHTNLFDRIDFFSEYFLGKPYIANPQGEGLGSEIDEAPLYRVDGFDCLTYVNNVLALSHANNEAEFIATLLKLNYYDSKPRYENRFHFMELDWNPQNQKNNIITDITRTFGMEVCTAVGEIDKANWFVYKYQAILAKQFSVHLAKVDYLPLRNILQKPALYVHFPALSIVEIVRPNWQMREKIGTNIHISHLGFAVRSKTDPHSLLFRHASSEQKKVVSVPLDVYLKHCLTFDSIQGIAVMGVVGFG